MKHIIRLTNDGIVRHAQRSREEWSYRAIHHQCAAKGELNGKREGTHVKGKHVELGRQARATFPA